MLRKMTYLRYFQDYNYHQLLQEAKKLGYFRSLSREAIVKILEENEIRQYELPDNQKPSHSLFFPRIFLCQEILKRDSSQNIVFPASHLAKILKQQMDDRQESKKNLLYMLISCNYNLNEVPLETFLDVLKEFKEPFNVITQENLSYIMNIGLYTEELWNYFWKFREKANFSEISLFFQTMNSIHNCFDKRFSAKHSPAQINIIKDLFSRVLNLIEAENTFEIAFLINEAKFFTSREPLEEMEMIQLKMFEKLIKGEDPVDEKEIKIILMNIPKDSYFKNPEKIDRLFKSIETKARNYWTGDFFYLTFSLCQSGYKLGKNMILKLDEIPTEYFKSFNYEQLLTIFKCFRDAGVLNENFSRTILDAIDWTFPKSSFHYEKIIDLIYESHKSNYSDFIMNCPRLIRRVFNCKNELLFHSLCKFQIFLLPHLQNSELLEPTLNALYEKITSGEIKNYIELIKELQETVLLTLQEEPIFNYQLESYEWIDLKVIILANELNSLIKSMNPSHPLVFQFYSRTRSEMKVQDFQVEIDLKNVFDMSKCAWIYKPGAEISQNLLNFLMRQECSLVRSHDFQEAVFYLLASGASKDSVNFELIDQDSPYFLAICFELGKVPLVTEKILNNIRHVSLGGEALLKSILVSIEAGVDKRQIQRLALNLTFKPELNPDIDSKILNKFVFLAETRNLEIDSTAYLNFLAGDIHRIEENFKEMIKNRMKIDEKGLAQALDQVKNLKKTKKINETQISPIFPTHPQDTLEKNVKILEEMIEKRTSSKNFMTNLFESMNQLSPSECLKLFSPILECFSLFPNFDQNFDQVFQMIKEKNLLEKLSDEDFINLSAFEIFSDYNGNTVALEKRLKNIFEKRLNREDPLKTNGIFKFFEPFSYRTEYEKRFLVSRKVSLEEVSSFESDKIKNSMKEFLDDIKFYFVFKVKLLKNDENAIEGINSFIHKKIDDDLFFEIKKSFSSQVFQDLDLEFFSSDEKFSFIYIKSVSDIIYQVHQSKGGIIFLDEQEFVNRNQTQEIMLPVKFLIRYIEKSTKIKLLPIKIQDWNSKILPSPSSLLDFINKNKKTQK